ncbi:hypothetical protein Tcan_12516 [Toxocara canis]|uniref:Secreted protein n=1 Tax=Toxocara canis TaxID=6265 RepID=A0A0B2V3Y2_TOXCA|nr:hypothetical protein Tcan_12516 [Toxocara canis]
MLLLRASAVVLWTVQVQAIIPSRFEDIHRRSSHHTCDTNDECQARLKSLWSPYTFVCCTTVVCDENYGNYYLAYSGCTPQRQCAPIVQMKGYSRFAGWFVRLFFLQKLLRIWKCFIQDH